MVGSDLSTSFRHPLAFSAYARQTPLMSELPPPSDAGLAGRPTAPDLVQQQLRAQADILRREADAIDAELRALQACDRPDVWQGGRATAFRTGLEDHLRDLSAPGFGLTDALREAATRMERRAEGLGAAPR